MSNIGTDDGEFFDGNQIRTTDHETGEERWFHWSEIGGHLVLITKLKVKGGEHDGATTRKQLWFDGDLSDKGGETKAWEHLEGLGYTGRDLGELEDMDCWGGPVRYSVYLDKNGYDNVGWIGVGGGGGSTSLKINRMDPDAQRRFAAMVRARAGSGPPPAPAAQKPVAPAQPAAAPSLNPWDPGYVNPNDDLPSGL